MSETEDIVPCPRCGAAMTLAPGIDYFCKTPGCEKAKFAELFVNKGCDLCGDQGPLLLHARCHLTAPLQVELDGDMMIIRCYLPDCRREVARFKVERDSRNAGAN